MIPFPLHLVQAITSAVKFMSAEFLSRSENTVLL